MKGHAPRGHDHRAMWREMFDTATADIGTYGSAYMGPKDPDTHSITDRFSPEDVSTHVAKAKGRRQFEDALGSCIFCTWAPLRFVLEAFNSVTGWEFTAKKLKTSASEWPILCAPSTSDMVFPSISSNPRPAGVQPRRTVRPRHQYRTALGRDAGQLPSIDGLG